MKVVVCGTFDLFHEGHQELILYAQLIGELERIFITTNEFVANKKKLKQRLVTRMDMLKMFGVEVTPICDKELFQEQIKALSPCILLHGNDHNINTLSEIYGVEHDWWIDNNIYLLYKDRKQGISSTELRKQYE